jgi:phosphopantetheinyl transferase (holo-ACP synthase)
MPLRPLPIPFKVGIDICSIPRVRSLLLAASPEQLAKEGPSVNIRGENVKLEDAPVRRVPFEPIKSVSRETNEHLAKMYRHLNPHFLVKLFRPEEIATLRSLHQRVVGGLAHERIYQHVAGRYVTHLIV